MSTLDSIKQDGSIPKVTESNSHSHSSDKSIFAHDYLVDDINNDDANERDVRALAGHREAWSSPSKKHGLSLLDTRISDRPADYEPPASLRGPPPPDLLFSNNNHNDDMYDNEPGPSNYASERARRRRVSLADFRRSEGPQIRSAKLQALWTSLPDDLPAPSRGPTPTSLMHLPGQGTIGILSPERVERLRRLYEEELSRRICLEERSSARLWGGADDLPEPNVAVVTTTPTSAMSSMTASSSSAINTPMSVNAAKKGIRWKDFRKFLWDQEEQLWDIFCDLDRDGDGRLDHHELKGALSRSGIQMTDSTLYDFVQFLSSSSPASRPECQPKENPQRERERKKTQQERTFITFAEFRDFLLLLPRKASVAEIYKYYQVRKRINDGRGAARLNMDGDLSVSFPKPAPSTTSATSSSASVNSAAHPQVVSGGPADTRVADKASPPGHQKHAVISCKDREARLVDGHEVCDEEIRGNAAEQSVEGSGAHYQHLHDEDEEEEEEGVSGIGADVAWKFLLAGGIAGAVSRTATAPFDRLKVYLITSTPTPDAMKVAKDPKAPITMTSRIVEQSAKYGSKGVGHLVDAVTRIYRDGGGARAFWVGNGLNVTKIFPESAIKFFSYEYSKRFLARYWDHVADQTEISGTSRFISGGIGGITSQLMIYPVETLKTQLQSHLKKDEPPKTKGAIVESAMVRTAKGMWKRGGLRAYYRGLTLGLIGVFPYSAIDMSTFEALKIAYCKSFALEEPQTVAVLCFGALSGSIGATSVYPINLLRTRLQASGSPGHPQVYTGFRDVLSQTLQREGWFGLYKGLIPTLAKVVPAVSISYVVYEHSKRSLHLS